jgi:hypothetical protein
MASMRRRTAPEVFTPNAPHPTPSHSKVLASSVTIKKKHKNNDINDIDRMLSALNSAEIAG